MKEIKNETKLFVAAMVVLIILGLVLLGFSVSSFVQAGNTVTDKYAIFRDLLVILLAIFGIGGYALYRDVRNRLVARMRRIAEDTEARMHKIAEETERKLDSQVKEQSDALPSRSYMTTSSLWGRLYEQFLPEKRSELIGYAVVEAARALRHAESLDERKYWKEQMDALNNCVMALAEKGDVSLRNEAHQKSEKLTQLVNRHKEKLTLDEQQGIQETIYFLQRMLPRPATDDYDKALSDFLSLKSHPRFEIWQTRWTKFGILEINEPNP